MMVIMTIMTILIIIKNEHNSKNYNDFANVEKSKEIILNLEEHRGLIW